MLNFLKAFLAFAAIIAVIALGLFWPSEDPVKEDEFVPSLEMPTLAAFTAVNPDFQLSDIVRLQSVHSSRDELRAGRFKYRPDDIVWTFTTPVDWSKRADALEVRRVLQRVAIADPFLKSYDETGDKEDFKQAAFFFLDWQSYFQTGHKVTEHAWDVDAVEGRVGRLAYILSEVNKNRDLLPKDDILRLINLVDYHIQRALDPVYGAEQNLSAQTAAFKAACRVVSELPSCIKVSGNPK